MTLVALPSPIPLFTATVGNTAAGANVSGGVATNTCDNSGDRLAVTLRLHEARTITKVRFRVGTITNAGTSTTVNIETVGTDGKPSGTLFNTSGGGSTGSVTVSGSNTWQLITLAASASVGVDDEFAIVLSTSGTPNFTAMLYQDTEVSSFGGIESVIWVDNGGSGTTYAAVISSAPVEIILEDASGPFWCPGLIPLDGAVTLQSVSTGGTEEYGLRFQVPFKCRICGIGIYGYNFAAGADTTAYLYTAADGTQRAASSTKDGDQVQSTTIDGFVAYWFTTPYTAAIGTNYYATVYNATANAFSLGILSLPSITGVLQAMPGGTNCYLVSRNWTGGTPGSFTEDTAKVPQICVFVDQLDDGAGGAGGLAANPAGGFIG